MGAEAVLAGLTEAALLVRDGLSVRSVEVDEEDESEVVETDVAGAPDSVVAGLRPGSIDMLGSDGIRIDSGCPPTLCVCRCHLSSCPMSLTAASTS